MAKCGKIMTGFVLVLYVIYCLFSAHAAPMRHSLPLSLAIVALSGSPPKYISIACSNGFLSRAQWEKSVIDDWNFQVVGIAEDLLDRASFKCIHNPCQHAQAVAKHGVIKIGMRFGNRCKLRNAAPFRYDPGPESAER